MRSPDGRGSRGCSRRSGRSPLRRRQPASSLPTRRSRSPSRCDPELYDFDQLLERGRAVGNPAEPLVRALRGGGRRRCCGLCPPRRDEPGRHGHRDDARRARRARPRSRGSRGRRAPAGRARGGAPLDADGRRTLLQHALPTTFGLKAAGRLVALQEARERLVAVRDDRLAAELGGAAGTLAALGDDGPEVLGSTPTSSSSSSPCFLAHESHADRRLRGGARHVRGVLAKIGLDLALLAQTEVAEVREGGTGEVVDPPAEAQPDPLDARARAEAYPGYASVLARTVVQSTSARPAPGTRSGRRSREPSRSRVARLPRSTRPSPGSRSTRSGCAATSSSRTAHPLRAGGARGGWRGRARRRPRGCSRRSRIGPLVRGRAAWQRPGLALGRAARGSSRPGDLHRLGRGVRGPRARRVPEPTGGGRMRLAHSVRSQTRCSCALSSLGRHATCGSPSFRHSSPTSASCATTTPATGSRPRPTSRSRSRISR